MIKKEIKETWRDIPGFEGLYQASSEGRVKRLAGFHCKNEKILKPGKSGDYWHISLCHKCYLLHRIIAFTFPDICGEYFDGADINHKDENPGNNAASNLEFCSRSYNNSYGGRLKRVSNSNKNNPAYSKKTIQMTLEGEVIKEWASTKEIERVLGYNNAYISACCRGKYKQAYGYIWKYA